MKQFVQAGNYWLIVPTPASAQRGVRPEWDIGQRDKKTGKALKVPVREQYLEVESPTDVLDEKEQRQLQAKTEDRILSLFNDLNRVFVTHRGWQRNASTTGTGFVLTNHVSAFELDADGNVRDIDWFDKLDF